MKDFDFDELDRAVSSVLTKKKQTDDTTVSTTDNQQNTPATDVASQTSDTTNSSNDSTTNDATSDAVVTEPEASAPEPPLSADTVDQSEDTTSDSPVDDSNDAQTPQQAHDELMHEQLPEVPVVEDTSDQADNTTNDSDDASEAPHVSNNHGEHSDALDNKNADIATSDGTFESSHNDSMSDTATRAGVTVPKRGRFMDVVHPSADMKTEPKPAQTHGGITLIPSRNFSVNDSTDDDEKVYDAPAAPSPVDEVEEPSTSEQLSVSNQDQVSDDANKSHSEDTDKPAQNHDVSTPFIPDVPVEKRPLNALNEDESTEEKTDSQAEIDKADVVATDAQSVSTPREFAPDVMAVEANENVGEDTADTSDAAVAVATAPVVTGGEINQEPHPVFDAQSYQQPLETPKAKTSHVLWLIIALILFLVGAAIGVLYFLYGQQ